MPIKEFAFISILIIIILILTIYWLDFLVINRLLKLTITKFKNLKYILI